MFFGKVKRFKTVTGWNESWNNGTHNGNAEQDYFSVNRVECIFCID